MVNNLEFRVLGPVELLRDGSPVHLVGSTVLTVLTALLLRPNVIVPTEELIDDIWAAELPEHPRAALHNAVSRIRKIIGPIQLETFDWGYKLRADIGHHDLLFFNHLSAAADSAVAEGSLSKALRLQGTALELWRMPVLGNITASPLAATEVPHLTERYLCAMERRADLCIRVGHYGAMANELPRLISLHPLRESLTAYLMVALARSERRSGALSAYQVLRKNLHDELAILPSRSMQRLYSLILCNDAVVEVPQDMCPWRTPTGLTAVTRDYPQTAR